jgi:hypothetical protein
MKEIKSKSNEQLIAVCLLKEKSAIFCAILNGNGNTYVAWTTTTKLENKQTVIASVPD